MKKTNMQFFHWYTWYNMYLDTNRMAQKCYTIVQFEDELQVAPNNWLDISIMKAVWPHFFSDSRYYKAVKCMQTSKSTWKRYTFFKNL